MKTFLKMTLATIVGLIVFSLISAIMGVVFLGIIAASSDTEVTIKPTAVYQLDLNAPLVERVESEEYAELLSLFSGKDQAISLEDVLRNIHNAQANDNIKGIYLNFDGLTAAPASVQALRNALLDFKKSGKFIVAYADNYSQADYWVASVADKVYLNPVGVVALTGMNMQTIFYTETLEKIGVKMQVFRVGTFKSAVEPFTETQMSPANRMQMLSLANGIWNQLEQHVADSRHIAIDSIQSFANQGAFLKDNHMLLTYNLIDSLCYENDMDSVIEKMVGAEPHFYTNSEMNKVKKSTSNKGGRIAVLYAYGDIDGGGEGEMNSSDIVDELNSLAENDKVKAVVLRVNSPGGSAFGSEQMWHAAQMLKEKKPLVVSMGDYAASGGYYMSCNADYIIAEPTTLTGSIGIFGMFPDAQGLVKKIGLHVDQVSTADYADFGNITRPMTAGEKAILQAHIEQGYELFVKRCAEGRNLPVDSIKAIAQGRVWLGAQAVKIGLVDSLGGLDQAVAKAAQLAKLDNYYVRAYPAPSSLMTKLMKDFKKSSKVSMLKTLLGDDYHYLDAIQTARSCTGVQARLPYSIYFE